MSFYSVEDITPTLDTTDIPVDLLYEDFDPNQNLDWVDELPKLEPQRVQITAPPPPQYDPDMVPISPPATPDPRRSAAPPAQPKTISAIQALVMRRQRAAAGPTVQAAQASVPPGSQVPAGNGHGSGVRPPAFIGYSGFTLQDNSRTSIAHQPIAYVPLTPPPQPESPSEQDVMWMLGLPQQNNTSS